MSKNRKTFKKDKPIKFCLLMNGTFINQCNYKYFLYTTEDNILEFYNILKFIIEMLEYFMPTIMENILLREYHFTVPEVCKVALSSTIANTFLFFLKQHIKQN